MGSAGFGGCVLETELIGNSVFLHPDWELSMTDRRAFDAATLAIDNKRLADE